MEWHDYWWRGYPSDNARVHQAQSGISQKGQAHYQQTIIFVSHALLLKLLNGPDVTKRAITDVNSIVSGWNYDTGVY